MEIGQQQTLRQEAECTATDMTGLMNGVMYVTGEDLTNTSGDWTLVDAKKRRREGKKQSQKGDSRYQMKDSPGWRRESGWRAEKARERPRQRAYTVRQVAVLVESTKQLNDMEDSWAVPPDLQRPKRRPARDATPARSINDLSEWDAPPKDLDSSSGWDVDS